MTIDMNDDHIVSVAQLREFVKLSNNAKFISTNQGETYGWIGRTLGKFGYAKLQKKEKSVVKKYLVMMTGYSETQIDRLIARKKKWGRVAQRKRTQPTFPSIYSAEDIVLLSEVDNAEGRRTGAAAKKTCHDMYQVYGDKRFERLAGISVSHLYSLRGTQVYESRSLTYTKTQATSVNIGLRIKPKPEGVPGFLRVDSVHQGDQDKAKGVYHINLVDEVTQVEIIVCVEGISEFFLLPALEAALDQFPFVIRNFHSDNGSEYVNKVVAGLLQKLLIAQTKSRARQTNDNALVEGKNGAVIRKHLGRAHIPKKYAPLINRWYRDYFNPYLNFHRQCAFAEEKIDARGKVQKVYNDYQTPVQKLLSIKSAGEYLKPGITKESLGTRMMGKTHLAAAEEMQKEKEQLFAKIHRQMI
jgi:hypothetical protein